VYRSFPKLRYIITQPGGDETQHKSLTNLWLLLSGVLDV